MRHRKDLHYLKLKHQTIEKVDMSKMSTVG